ncbi:CBS domain-containing protein [bacterium]|jgi:arabinose-5-phosphate isomerase|nr:CBS domain-containing protein [bacterium]
MYILETDIVVDEVMMSIDKISVVGARDIFKQVISSIHDTGYGISCIVNDELDLLGVITDGDIRRVILNNQRPLSSILLDNSIEFVSKNTITIESKTNIIEALYILQDARIWDAPVVKNNKLIGLLHLHAVVGHILKKVK